MASRILADIRRSLVARCGFNSLRALRATLDTCVSASEFRTALASFGIRISDEDFATISALQFDALRDGILEKLSPRRQLVVDEAFRKLRSVQDPVTEDLLRDFFDPSRLEGVARKLELESDVLDTFFEAFPGNAIVDAFGFSAYYGGVSCSIASDVDFEKHVMRSWNLDKGIPVSRSELRALAETIPKSKMAREHPLYQTAAQQHGKDLDKAFEVPTEHHRNGHFTKHAPPPKPSSGLNTGSTRSKVL